MRKLLIFNILLVLVITGCKKDEPVHEANQYRHYLNSSLDGYRFREGSFWVYFNPFSLQLDSLTVTQLSEGFETYYDNSNNNVPPDEVRVQFHDVEIYSNNHDYIEHLYLANNAIYNTAYHPDFPDQNTPLYFSSTEVGTEDNGAYVVEMHDSLFVCCTMFYDVIQMRYDNPLVHWSTAPYNAGEFYFIDYFWVDGVGIVRKEIHENSGEFQRWDLVNWNTEF